MTVPVARSVEAIPVEPCLIAEVTPVVSKFESAKIGEVALSEPVQACLETWTQQVLSVQRDAVNPYIMGFIRDPAGKMQPIHGPKAFSSQRDLSAYPILFGVDTRREVFLMSSSAVAVESPQLLKGKYWDYLPEKLKHIFTAGHILVTDGEDHYPAPTEDWRSRSLVMPELEQVDKAIASVSQSDLSILYTGGYRIGGSRSSEGRTGVVVRAGKDGIAPVIVEINGEEYIIELKGCGTSSGGFAGLHYRTGRDIVTGGCEAVQAIDEIRNLDTSTIASGSKAAVAITFHNSDERLLSKSKTPYEQGYVVRFVPSTVRASYARMDAYPTVSDPEHSRTVMKMFAIGLAGGIAEPNPSIIDRSAHSENIALWGDGRFELTDFSDHVPFNHPQYPRSENEGGFMTAKAMLGYFIDRLTEIPGFTTSGGYEAFANYLEEELRGIGFDDLDLSVANDSGQITEAVWRAGFARSVLEARTRSGYQAEGIVHEATHQFRHRLAKLGITTEASFVETYDTYTDGLADAMDKLYPDNAPHISASGAGSGTYEEELFHIHISKVYDAYKLYGEKFEAQFERLLDVYRVMKCSIGPVRQYLADELDIIETAFMTASGERRAAYDAHRQAVLQKDAEFEKIISSPADFWRLLTTPIKMARFLKFDAYNGSQDDPARAEQA